MKQANDVKAEPGAVYPITPALGIIALERHTVSEGKETAESLAPLLRIAASDARMVMLPPEGWRYVLLNPPRDNAAGDSA